MGKRLIFPSILTRFLLLCDETNEFGASKATKLSSKNSEIANCIEIIKRLYIELSRHKSSNKGTNQRRARNIVASP